MINEIYDNSKCSSCYWEKIKARDGVCYFGYTCRCDEMYKPKKMSFQEKVKSILKEIEK